ncbi:hypothetical protein DYU05_03925 [Mucilaginibacter terrenus]|uniref:Uncharacterized protein n=1 Tax=Mucilaginibacter terrenus TaxID=2482727 RepID=A0A3E2NUS9_9SPHI|nr:hypothetical protein [Mucilaginibacter terrenus]RFZ84763.1 hypothetical protein DYU05_03925 [Mucilaginibacter terrenus]
MKTNRSRLFEGKNTGGGSGSGGGDSAFNGQRPITRQTPGLIGVNPDALTVIEMLENVFYPPVAPITALTVNNPVREIGQSAAYTLTWNVTRQSNAITGITVDGVAKVPTGDSQAGTQNGNFPGTIGTFTKSMTATDGTLSSDATATVTYMPRMFWGTTTKDGSSAHPILDADILGLAGSELREDRFKNYANLGGGGTYLLFAFPSYFGTPSYVINGLANTAFTKVRSASNFVNSQGATIVMDVWISNNFYNSALASVTIN